MEFNQRHANRFSHRHTVRPLVFRLARRSRGRTEERGINEYQEGEEKEEALVFHESSLAFFPLDPSWRFHSLGNR